MTAPIQVEIELIEDSSQLAGELQLAARVRVRATMPEQNEHLPFMWELVSQEAGLQLMRRLFRFGIEKSDLDLILSLRTGENGQGIVRIGKRASIFKTVFGTIKVPRIRIKYKGSGKSETPSSRFWQLPRQIYISRGLKNAVSSTAAKESYGNSLKQIERETGERGIISKSSVLNIVHEQGGQISAAEIARADKVFAADARAKILLGRAAAHLAEDHFERTWLPGEDLASMDVAQAYEKIEWDADAALAQASAGAGSAVSEPVIRQSLPITTARDLIATDQLLPSIITAHEPIAATPLQINQAVQPADDRKAAAATDQAVTEQIIVQVDEVVTSKQPSMKWAPTSREKRKKDSCAANAAAKKEKIRTFTKAWRRIKKISVLKRVQA